MQRRRIVVRSQLRARLRTLRLGHLWAGSYWFGCRWGRREGRPSSLPNEMRTNLDLLDVGSTWLPFPEVAGNILTDLLLERNRSRKLNFVLTEFSELPLYSVLRSSSQMTYHEARGPGAIGPGAFRDPVPHPDDNAYTLRALDINACTTAARFPPCVHYADVPALAPVGRVQLVAVCDVDPVGAPAA
jgi:hypothetical protein